MDSSNAFYLTDERWKRIAALLPGKEGDPGRHGRDNRLFIEAVFWMIRTDATWRNLPQQFGKWYTIYTRFHRWMQNGVWADVLDALAVEETCEYFYKEGSIRYEPAQRRAGKATLQPDCAIAPSSE
jgi:transposase